jgi:glycosyltransferase involved in cell wall biosynthesis
VSAASRAGGPQRLQESRATHAQGADSALVDPARAEAARAFLHANDVAYSHLVRRVVSQDAGRSPDTVLDAIAAAANFASSFHPGRFSDGTLENRVLEIGRSEQFVATQVPEPRHRRAAETPLRVLHVATRVLSVGGHSRMIHRWISEDRDNRHSMALTCQDRGDIPVWLTEALDSAGDAILALGETAPARERAAALRRHAHASADVVVLHHFGDDVIPGLAFAVDGGPPVIVVNHADHMFWLGNSVADLCVDLRSITNEHSVSRRHIERTTVLPIPLPAPIDDVDRAAARCELGAGPDEVILLTVARATKFRPCGGQDFLATVETVLARDPAIHLYVIGETDRGMRQLLARLPHPRIHCLGAVEHPARHRAAADVYIETFPFGSNTALLEAALDGLPVVPACRPLTKLLVAANDSLQGLMTNPADEAEYVERILAFAGDPQGRRAYGRQLRDELSKHHVGSAWLSHLQRLYEVTEGLVHRPRPVPATRCEALAADIGLAMFNAASNGRSTSDRELHSRVAVLRHSAFVTKHARDFPRARRLSFEALLADVRGADTWRLFLVCLLGPIARAAGDWVRQMGRAG